MKQYVMTLCVCLVVLSLSATGCSNKLRTHAVEGTITLDSQPLAGANVSFIVKTEGQGHTAYGRTDDNGFYRLQTHLGEPNAGTTPGEYIVTISKTVPVPTGNKEMDDEGNYYDELDAKEVAPLRYTDPETTPLSATVIKGKNVHNFDLKSEP